MYNPILQNRLSLDKAGNQYGGGNPNTVYNTSATPANTSSQTNVVGGAPTTPTTPLAQWTPPQFGLPDMNPSAAPVVNAGSATGAADAVLGIQGRILDQNGQYMQNARQSGLELASRRGLMNSGLAAANSQKAAIEASGDLTRSAVGLYGRERDAQLNDWLSSEGAKRDAKYTLAALPIRSAYNMMEGLMAGAAENPEVYTPAYMNSMNNFFMTNMHNVLNNFFGAKATGGGG
jgi:hypothetical protein